MKRMLYLLIFLFVPVALHGQSSSAIDELFRKYEGKEGITSVYISSKMLGMFSSQDTKDEELGNVLGKLKSIRIITVEDSLLNEKINFYEELRKKTDFSGYEELMVVNEADNVTKFLVMESGKTIVELLIITGGKNGNSLISIRGDLDLKNISSLSKSMGIKQLEELNKLEEEPQKK